VVDTYLVDTNVIVRWYIEQVGFEHARRVQRAFLGGAVELHTVDFVRIELAEVLRKRGLLNGRLTHMQYLAAVRDVDELGVVVHRTDAEALERAADLAERRTLRVYDALVTDRAIQLGMPLLTGDAKLCSAVGGMLSTELLEGIARGGSAP
jgi:predicted nucleic acid-binding protein